MTKTGIFQNNNLANFIKTCPENELAEKLHFTDETSNQKKMALKSLLDLGPSQSTRLTEGITREIRGK